MVSHRETICLNRQRYGQQKVNKATPDHPNPPEPIWLTK
jgi:hypothetical protein